MIDRLDQGERLENRIVRFPERCLVRRASTYMLKRSDAAVGRAADFIRAHAVEGISVADVVKVVGCSRRSAEIRFRAATGCAIFEMIDAVRIEQVKDLLRNPLQSIAPLAVRCGFGTEANLRRAFRLATGMSPREWRKLNA